MTYRQLEHDLYWGERLALLQAIHRADGFRGNAKGKGFRAHLAAEKIPPRKAYRLIDRYRRLSGIWYRVEAANAALRAEALRPLPLGALEKLQAMCDSDSDTNEAAE